MNISDRSRWRCIVTLGLAFIGLAQSTSVSAALTAETGLAAPAREVEAAPARVQVSGLEAFEAGGRVVVRWETSLELGALCYNLYRETGSQWTKVNSELVPAVNALPGGIYEVVDAGVDSAAGKSYRLEVVTLSGQPEVLARQRISSLQPATRHASPAASGGARPAVRAVPRVDAGVSSGGLLIRDLGNAASGAGIDVAPVTESASLESAAVATPGELRRRSVALAAGGGGPLSTEWIKIRTVAEGIHFVSAQSIATALGGGQTAANVTTWINNGQIAMSNRDLPVKFIPGTGPSSAAGLFFYAELNRNNYTYENVYWLKAGSNTSGTLDGQSPAHDTQPGTYQALLDQESDDIVITAFCSDPEEDFWAWQGLLVETAAPTASWSIPGFSLGRIVKTVGVNATLNLRVHGASLTPNQVSVTVNGVAVGTRSFANSVAVVLQYDVPSTVLKDTDASEGQNVIVVTSTLASGASAGLVYVDGFQLTYPRRYYAPSSGYLEAAVEGNSVATARGFLLSTVLAFDVSDVRNPRKFTQGVTVSKNGGSDYWVSLLPGAVSRFVVFTPALSSAMKTPVGVTRVVPGEDLKTRDHRASYVIITVPALADAAAALANYRSNPTDRFRPRVILLDELYTQFRDGLVTPHAIADFVSLAESTWAIPPRFVALLGNGTYDYRNLQSKADNLVPPLMTSTPFGLFATDTRFGDTRDDGLVRVAFGRFGVTTKAQFDPILQKIRAYEAQSLAGPLRAVLIADRSPEPAGDFVANITSSALILSPRYQSQLIYPKPYPHPTFDPNVPPSDLAQVRSDVQSAINLGDDWLNYVGHGAIDRFGRAGYLTVADADQLGYFTNNQRWPFVAAMTCVAGSFSSPGYPCLVEALVGAASRGAIGAIAPTGLSYDADATWINLRLMEVVSRTGSGRVGDAWMQAVNLYQRSGAKSTPIWIYNIIGDPALKVRVPVSGP